jgi:TRAP-type C4-dicarboxylate transport system permease small subunit
MKKYVLSMIDHLSLYGLAISGISIMAMMTAEFLNALGRKFLIPLPCCLEMSESLMISTIFLAVPYVALEEGHTNVTILTRKFPFRVQRLMDSFSHIFGMVIFSILAWGGWRIAFASVKQLEMRIGVFRFPIWPFRILFAIGLSLLVFQSLSNVIKCLSDAWDRKYKTE